MEPAFKNWSPKDTLISLPWVPAMDFFQVPLALFIIVWSIFSLFLEEKRVVDDTVLLDVDSLRQRVQGNSPHFPCPPGKEAHVVSGPLTCGSWRCSTFKVIFHLMHVYLPNRA